MLDVDALAQLSRYRAGELSELERAAVEQQVLSTAEGRAALAMLDELDVLSADLARLDRAPREPVKRPSAPRARPLWPWAALAAALAAAAITRFFDGGTAAPPADPGTNRAVEVVEAHPMPRRAPGAGERIGLEADGLLATPTGDWVALEGTVLSQGDGGYRLEAGMVLLRGPAELDGYTFDGTALVCREPECTSAHVMRVAALTRNEELDTMSTKVWTKLGALSVVVLSGTVAAAPPPQQQPVSKTAPATPAISIDALNDAVVQRQHEIARCFEQGLKSNPKLSGSLPMRLRMKRDGAFTRLEYLDLAESYTVENPLVASCVMRELFKVTLPPTTEERLELRYELRFEQRGQPTGVQVFLPKGDSLQRVMMQPRVEKVPVDVGSSQTLGPEKAPVTVVLFSSSHCTFCLDSVKTLRELEQVYGARVRFVYKHRVLASEPESRLSAVAAQAAAEQGQFWSFIAKTYVAEPLQAAQLEQIASELRLDINRWRLARDGKAAAAQVDADIAQAELLGVKGIPSWFINGKEVVGKRPVAELRREIDLALAAAP